MGGEQILMVNGVDLCVDTFGDPGDPTLLLIGGAASSMDWWDPVFCERLAAGRRFVIRYDQRDTGRSTTYQAGRAPYTMADLAADAAGVLDAVGVRSAHLVGMSLGAVVALRVAADRPDRVESLALLSASPGGERLPPMSDDLQAYFDAEPWPPDWSDRAAIIEYIVGVERAFEAPEYFDETRVRRLAERLIDRADDIGAGMTNWSAIDTGEPIRARLGEVRAPALVIHGTADPVYPFGHAEAMAGELPDARLVPLDGVGHQMPPPEVWPTVVAALLRHTSGGWRAQEDRLASRSLAAGDAVGWFDQLYAAGAAGEVDLGPWARDAPDPLLVEWTRAREPSGRGQRAAVVGCGLGADAEHVASLGYDTTAFDIADNAVRLARQRHPASRVDYVTADVLEPPTGWLAAFDLVVEVITVQALPEPPRRRAIVSISRLVAPGGTLVVIASRRDDSQPNRKLPPWPLTRAEVDAFAGDGLRPIRIEELGEPGGLWWRAEFSRPPVEPGLRRRPQAHR
jgi:pimeloyl-ACP methyl ester carboxylesterase/SAM-dependent methyltransferase